MTRTPSSRSAALLGAVFALTLLALFVVRARPIDARAQGAANEFYDSHFHLTNYIQEGIGVGQFLQIMGSRVGRSTLFGIPLQQQWSYANSADFAPTYYLHTRRAALLLLVHRRRDCERVSRAAERASRRASTR